MKNLVLVAGLLLGLGQQAFSQSKEFENREQLWLAYFNQSRFSRHHGLWLDLHLRLTNDFVKDVGITIARAGYTYYLSDPVRLTAGYAYATQYSDTGPDVPEHRFWQQVQWFEKKPSLNLMQWFRVEERYRTKVEAGELTDEYLFNWRFRYNFSMTIPLKGKFVAPGIPFIFLNDEIHINAGKNIVYNYFDQNRLFLGLGYQFTTHVNAQLGYMYVFQQLPSGNTYLNINAIRLFVFHNMDFRGKTD